VGDWGINQGHRQAIAFIFTLIWSDLVGFGLIHVAGRGAVAAHSPQSTVHSPEPGALVPEGRSPKSAGKSEARNPRAGKRGCLEAGGSGSGAATQYSKWAKSEAETVQKRCGNAGQIAGWGFMGSLLSFSRAHWDHEPRRSGVSAERRWRWFRGVAALCRDAATRARFMERPAARLAGMSGANGEGGTLAAGREVIIGHNWLKWLQMG